MALDPNSGMGAERCRAKRRRGRFVCSCVLGLCALLLGSALLAACGPSGSPRVATSNVHGVCEDVSAVLSDGPDPETDPVGYAEAQVDPLRQIHTSDQQLQRAIDDLASAYEGFFKTDGSTAAKRALNTAISQINAICPGAAS